MGLKTEKEFTFSDRAELDIMDEEKEHIAKLTCVLIKKDPTQEKYFKKSLKIPDIKELDCLRHLSNKE